MSIREKSAFLWVHEDNVSNAKTYVQVFDREGSRYLKSGTLISDDGTITVLINDSQPVTLKVGEKLTFTGVDGLVIERLEIRTTSTTPLKYRAYFATWTEDELKALQVSGER